MLISSQSNSFNTQVYQAPQFLFYMNLNFWKCWAMLLKCVDNSHRGGLSLTFLLIVSPTNSPLHIEDTIPHDTTQSDTVLSGSIEFSFTPLSHNWSKQTLLKEHIWCSTYRLPQHLIALKQLELSTKKAHSLKCPPTRCVCTHTDTHKHSHCLTTLPPNWMPLSWRPHNDSKFHPKTERAVPRDQK